MTSDRRSLPGVSTWWANQPGLRTVPDGGAPLADPQPVHRILPGYAQTPLRQAPALAAAGGFRRVWVKDESSRCGLPSFKVLGASYALHEEMRTRLGRAEPLRSLAQWRQAAHDLGVMTLVTATDGNHGRALAYLARLLGLQARVLVPDTLARSRVQAIRREGARVQRVAGTYDEAVAALAHDTDPGDLVVSDTSWEGYEETPRWVIAGYETIFAELDAQLATAKAARPQLVVVQAGVGALAAAAARHWSLSTVARPKIISVEPEDAACVFAALARGEPSLVAGPHASIMAGLNCGLVSRVALPTLLRGLDGALTITDAHAREAVRLMHGAGFATGETGAAGMAGLLALKASDDFVRVGLGIDDVEDVLVLCTEGVTDPTSVAHILGGSHIDAPVADSVGQ